MNERYEDIIHLPHHVSKTRPQMSIENRAAQFAPFAALTGYESVIKETARQTETKVELTESSIASLDAKLRLLSHIIETKPEVTVTHFVPDCKKDGGAYLTTTGSLLKIDHHTCSVLLENSRRIALCDILDIECEVLSAYQIEL